MRTRFSARVKTYTTCYGGALFLPERPRRINLGGALSWNPADGIVAAASGAGTANRTITLKGLVPTTEFGTKLRAIRITSASLIGSPTAVKTASCFSTRRITDVGVAPTARRMPISRIRGSQRRPQPVQPITAMKVTITPVATSRDRRKILPWC